MKALESYLKKQSTRKIIQHGHSLSKATEQLHHIIPGHLTPHCQVINFTHKHITIGTANATTSLQLKPLETTILSALSTLEFVSQQHQVVIKICPSLASKPKPSAQPISLSAFAKKIIQATAQSVKHPALKKSLEKLATAD